MKLHCQRARGTARLTLPTLALLVAAASPLAAADHFVGLGCSFTTLQAAVDAAASGDRIFLLANSELIGSTAILGKSLDVVGGAPDCSTPLAMGGYPTLRAPSLLPSRVLRIQGEAGDVVRISNLVLAGGELRSGSGGGLLVEGPGLRVELDQVVIGGRAEDRNVAARGGGLAVEGGAHLMAYETTISKNLALDEGGGLSLDGGRVDLVYGEVSENVSQTHGGGISARSGRLVATGLSLSANRAETNVSKYGGGLLFWPSAVVELYASRLEDNLAGDGGAVACVDDGSGGSGRALLEDTALTRNLASTFTAGVHLNCPGVELRLRSSSGGPPMVLSGHGRGLLTVLRGTLVVQGSQAAPVLIRDGLGTAGWPLLKAGVEGTLRLHEVVLSDHTWESAPLVTTRSDGRLELDRVQIVRIEAETLIEHIGGGLDILRSRFEDLSISELIRGETSFGPIRLESVLLHAIEVGEQLIQSRSPLSLAHTTFGALELRPGTGLLEAEGPVAFHNNLLTTPVALTAGGLTAATVDCVVAADPTLLGPATRVGFLGSPTAQFVDPEAGDFHLLPTAGAVDFCDDTLYEPTSTDIDGDPRRWPAQVEPAALDPGADEWVPLVFRDDFERGDASAWSAAVPGAERGQ